MAAKENFDKAMFDIFGVGHSAADGEPKKTCSESEKPASSVQRVIPAAPAAAPVVPVPAARPAQRSTTYLAQGTYMEGKLKTDNDVEVVGDFKGDLAAKGSVVIHSSITSNITAAQLELIDCRLTGDAHVSGRVTINAGSTVVGNIFAAEIVCAGHVRGNLEISGGSTFQRSSSVEGNISTHTMVMECGAVISGALIMNVGKDLPPEPAGKQERGSEA